MYLPEYDFYLDDNLRFDKIDKTHKMCYKKLFLEATYLTFESSRLHTDKM